MATSEEQFRSLQDRHQRLIREHAVISEQQRLTTERRTSLREELVKLGVDPDRPEEEIARLEKDIESFLETARASLNEFEGKLKGTIPVETTTIQASFVDGAIQAEVPAGTILGPETRIEVVMSAEANQPFKLPELSPDTPVQVELRPSEPPKVKIITSPADDIDIG
jgi:hypothetical protein